MGADFVPLAVPLVLFPSNSKLLLSGIVSTPSKIKDFENRFMNYFRVLIQTMSNCFYPLFVGWLVGLGLTAL